MTPRQRWVCLGLRAVILLLLILALAGPRISLPTRKVAAIFLLDQSASISADAARQARAFLETSLSAKRSGDTLGVIGFAGSPHVIVPADTSPSLPEKFSPPQTNDATHLADAITFASATFPAGAAKRLVILSDGNATDPAPEVAARQAAARGVAISAVPLENPALPEVAITALDAPRRVRSGEPFDVVAHIESTVATTATARLYINQFLSGPPLPIDLEPGMKTITFPNIRTDASFATVEIELLPAADTRLENNHLSTAITLRGEPRILIVDSQPDRIRPLMRALESAKMKTEARGENGLPRSLDDLQQFDLFILSDVSALSVSQGQMQLITTWVRDFGGAFLMLGGENSFGVGGWFRTDVEKLLPVRMEHDDRQETPVVALLVILDRSGSMSAPVAGQTKMALANHGAALAMEVLQSRDLFGVLAVDSAVHTVAPLAPLASRETVRDKILSITAGGGGIYIFTSLAEAFQRMREVEAKIKHVILFSDASDAEEKMAGEMGDGATGGGSSLDLATALLANRITTSVVALGLETDKDTEWLKQLAARGNGRFYLTSDALTLPQIFSTETMKVAQSSLLEEPFVPVPVSPSPATAGIDWTSAPLLLGYNATKPKPTATLLLATERGDPLLATWQFGLGQTAAFTSDAKARWAGEWLAWTGYEKFWSQLARHLIRTKESSAFRVITEPRGETLHITVDAVDPDGNFLNSLPVVLNAAGATSKPSTFDNQPSTLRQTARGRDELNHTPTATDTTMFSVSSPSLPESEYTFAHTPGYPAEYLRTRTDPERLRRLAEAGRGKFDPAPNAVFTPPSDLPATRRPLTPWLLAVALLLLPLDIYLRRREWRT